MCAHTNTREAPEKHALVNPVNMHRNKSVHAAQAEELSPSRARKRELSLSLCIFSYDADIDGALNKAFSKDIASAVLLAIVI